MALRRSSLGLAAEETTPSAPSSCAQQYPGTRSCHLTHEGVNVTLHDVWREASWNLLAPLPLKYCWRNSSAQWIRLAPTVTMFLSESTRLLTSALGHDRRGEDYALVPRRNRGWPVRVSLTCHSAGLTVTSVHQMVRRASDVQRTWWMCPSSQTRTASSVQLWHCVQNTVIGIQHHAHRASRGIR